MHYNNYYYYETSAAGSGAAWWSSSYNAPAAKRSVSSSLERIEGMASANAVVIFSVSTCCMCHAVKRLFWGMGVNPTVYEIDQDPSGHDLHAALLRLLRCGASSSSSLPVIFIGGRLVGGMDSVMASHISGALVPLLKDAGALWL